jgi:hypothetical protein
MLARVGPWKIAKLKWGLPIDMKYNPAIGLTCYTFRAGQMQVQVWPFQGQVCSINYVSRDRMFLMNHAEELLQRNRGNQIAPREDHGFQVYFNGMMDNYYPDSLSAARYIDGSDWLRKAAAQFTPVKLRWKERVCIFDAQEWEDGDYLFR